ncbi:hypothetical protein CONPUDRAFT_114275 [Coniophora puteana RWD-64-598 SS2]|uniref:Cytochrome c oxidase assembly protein COX16, mitochondrial n=1 Tax=Coniophora puteana (strain RWD-64-598) TaxID=741705 RepID=A0A5M3N3Z6_CONPW|nr:uncharacterized protein CONPUDRAFT_114275 [Coniophora puteana RWD-64-598 SS2]EIW86149.1 hypothetical protein CONPUDRAFT_114275 [Coniophora puteana RWD-64-598 SS2]
MPTFDSRPLNQPRWHNTLKKYPGLFGIPFLIIMVGASFGMQSFTQIRYDIHDKKNKTAVDEHALGLDKRKKKFDIREEYYKLSAQEDQDWEPKRIARPAGLPEWGVPPTEPPSAK